MGINKKEATIKTLSIIMCACLLGVIMGGCSAGKTPAAGSGVPLGTPAADPTALFLDTDAVVEIKPEDYVSRYRFVRINLDILFNKSGEPLELAPGTEITINLFPDVSYTGVIEKVTQSENVYSWSGYLKGIEYSELTMVYTAGAFIGHFAHPGGVYEVSLAGDDLYRVTMIDQTKLQGGEGDR